jgi:hypothetical protein
MTAVSTGSRLFPTTAQEPSPGGMFIAKGSADNAPMEWIVVATGAAFWLFIKPRSSNIGDPFDFAVPFFFGDIDSYKPTDLYKCAILGGLYSSRAGEGDTNPIFSAYQTQFFTESFGATISTYSRCLARSHTAAIGSSPFGLMNVSAIGSSLVMQGGNVPFPNPVDGGIYANKVVIHETVGGVGAVRGTLPGILQLCHPTGTFIVGDTFNGSGEFAGKTFEFVRVTSDAGMMAIETSNTW